MAEYLLEGEVNDFSDKQRDFIIKVIEERGFKNGNITIKNINDAGDNYGANVKRIITEKDGSTFKMIAKVAPTDEQKRAFSKIAPLFLNEFMMYNKILPMFTKLERAADIPEPERLRYAVLYGASMEARNEIILLEDLEVAGFTMLDRFISLEDEHVKLFLNSFAKLHALSYVLKNREPETFAAFANKLINVRELFHQSEEMSVYFTQLCLDVEELWNQEKYRKHVVEAIDQMFPMFKKLTKEDRGSKYSVIQQGDPWTNNCMFRLEDEKAVNCCMIDYQYSKEASPVADLHYMFFNCTDYETRSKHFHDWIDYYHFELDKYLSNFGIKANYVYPKDKLDADLRSYGKYTIAIAVMLASFSVKENEDATVVKAQINNDLESTVKQRKFSAASAETIQRFKTTIEGVVDSMLELGYI